MTAVVTEASGPGAGLVPVGLAELQGLADLQTRIDRKYVVRRELVSELLDEHPGLAVLEIAGRRSFGYESVYFDTPDLVSYRAAAHGRRRRFKVRTRTYTDAGDCVLEVKVAGGRGETVKERLAYRADRATVLDGEGRAFVAETFGASAVGSVGVVRALRPVLRTTYRRTTVVDPHAGTRVTIDDRLQCHGLAAAPVLARRHGEDGTDLMVVESKSPGRATPVDRWLWARGHRPVRLSKFAVGMAAIDPSLPSNRWTTTVRRYARVVEGAVSLMEPSSR